MSSVKTVTTDTWQAEVLDQPKPVLVDFSAVWCGPCRYLAPIVDQLAAELAANLVVTKLDIDESPDIAVKYQVDGVPTLALFNAGQEVDRMVGAAPKPAIKGWLDEAMARAAGKA